MTQTSRITRPFQSICQCTEGSISKRVVTHQELHNTTTIDEAYLSTNQKFVKQNNSISE
jgi:hypothetical protein